MSRVPKSLLEEPEDEVITEIDLSMAENWVNRAEVLKILKGAVRDNLAEDHLCWPTGFWGNSKLLGAFANFFNTYFKPNKPVEKSHITAAPGAAGCLDAILYNICDEGEGVLVPTPYWNGNDVFFSVRAGVTIVPASGISFDESLEVPLISALEDAYKNATCKIRGLVIANPHNPLGRCYPKSTLEACIKFCNAKNLHLISDEVFALSTFECPELPTAAPFVSVLSLDVLELGCDPSLVHVIWSPSKILGTSGLKVGCTITQSNNTMRNALSLAANMNISTMSAVVTTELLLSPELPSLMALNSERLLERYITLTEFLKRKNIIYYPCNASLSILAKVVPNAETWEEEAAVVQAAQKVGVLIGSGARYHVEEKGWVRITFAVSKLELEEAINRLDAVFISG